MEPAVPHCPMSFFLAYRSFMDSKWVTEGVTFHVSLLAKRGHATRRYVDARGSRRKPWEAIASRRGTARKGTSRVLSRRRVHQQQLLVYPTWAARTDLCIHFVPSLALATRHCGHQSCRIGQVPCARQSLRIISRMALTLRSPDLCWLRPARLLFFTNFHGTHRN